jgi:curved DNA-binding protein CbpA
MSERSLTLYEVLGVSSTSTLPTIRRAYYEHCRLLHPDRCAPDTFDASAFHRVQHAWEVLSQPNTRQQYDSSLGLHPTSSSTSSIAMSDYLDKISLEDLVPEDQDAEGWWYALCRCGGRVYVCEADLCVNDRVFHCKGCSLQYCIEL